MHITLASLPQARAQDVFNHCARHLMRQMQQSRRFSTVSQSTPCAYRGENGMKCVAGACIADDEYIPLMDDPLLLAQRKCDTLGYLTVGELEHGVTTRWGNLVELGVVPKAHCCLIQWLQSVHDQHQPQDWDFELRKLAEQFNLSPVVLDEVRH